MAGTPVRRARRAAAEVVMKKEKIAASDWLMMTDVDRIKAMYGCNLDQIRDLVSIDWADADLHEKVLIVRIYEVHMRMGRALARDKSRERETANLLRGVREALEERIAREADGHGIAQNNGATNPPPK